MQPLNLLFFATTMASSVMASSPVKRSYAPGRCGIHASQSTRSNNADFVEFTVYDNDGSQIGYNSGSLASPQPQTINSYLPEAITATQPPNSHDINLHYMGYDFGTANGCSVGQWDDGNDGTRQVDCGFAC